MASPQKENGNTSIAHELMEAILRGGFNKRELLIIFCILRMTYGWQRKAWAYTVREIAAMTGIESENIRKTIRALVESGVLIAGVDTIGIQKDYDEWGDRSKQPVKTGQNNRSIRSKQPVKTTGQNNRSKQPEPVKTTGQDRSKQPVDPVKTTGETPSNPAQDADSQTPKSRSKSSKSNTCVSDPVLLTLRANYPKCKRNKEWHKAEEAWWKQKLTDSEKAAMLVALEEDKASPDWKKDNGDWIPLPATWINKRRDRDISFVPPPSNVVPFAPKPEPAPKYGFDEWRAEALERKGFTKDLVTAGLEARRFNAILGTSVDDNRADAICAESGLDVALRWVFDQFVAQRKAQREAMTRDGTA